MYTTAPAVRKALSPDGADAIGATAAGMSDDALGDAILEAQAIVDGRANGAPYPDGAVPPLIAQVTRDVAVYLATLTYRKGSPLPNEHPVARRYAMADKLMEGMATGKVDLPTPPGGESGTAAVVNPYEGQLFSLEQSGIGADGSGTRW